MHPRHQVLRPAGRERLRLEIDPQRALAKHLSQRRPVHLTRLRGMQGERFPGEGRREERPRKIRLPLTHTPHPRR